MKLNLRKKELDGNVETMLLSLLSEQPSYGYAIVKSLNERAEGLMKLGEGTIYPVLHRLEERELIRAEWGTAPKSERKRKYYHITESGQAVLAENRDYWERLVDVMQRLGVTGTDSAPDQTALQNPNRLLTGDIS